MMIVALNKAPSRKAFLKIENLHQTNINLMSRRMMTVQIPRRMTPSRVYRSKIIAKINQTLRRR
jgi:hypothetical protein